MGSGCGSVGSWSLLTPEIRGSNPDIGEILTTNRTIEKTPIKKKRPGMAHLKKPIFCHLDSGTKPRFEAVDNKGLGGGLIVNRVRPRGHGYNFCILQTFFSKERAALKFVQG